VLWFGTVWTKVGTVTVKIYWFYDIHDLHPFSFLVIESHVFGYMSNFMNWVNRCIISCHSLISVVRIINRFNSNDIIVRILWYDARKPEEWSQNRRSLLGNESVNTFSMFSRVSGLQPVRMWASEQRNWIESSLRNWQIQNNGKKRIRLWQWDSYNSVARIRLLKTDNPSECVTVNCKVCRLAIALYYP
jgi:hypothetical protein